MTKVTIEEHDGYIGITAEGHSGYAGAGSDIVCAGISTMMFAWRGICEDLADEELIRIMEDDIRDGYMSILIYDPDNYSRRCFEMLLHAMNSIGEEYPANLCVEWDEIGS